MFVISPHTIINGANYPQTIELSEKKKGAKKSRRSQENLIKLKNVVAKIKYL